MKWEDLIGKTIIKVNDVSVNVVKLKFSDGTYVAIEADAVISTGYGNIYGPVLVSNEGVDMRKLRLLNE